MTADLSVLNNSISSDVLEERFTFSRGLMRSLDDSLLYLKRNDSLFFQQPELNFPDSSLSYPARKSTHAILLFDLDLCWLTAIHVVL
jgi:hypothetical protein